MSIPKREITTVLNGFPAVDAEVFRTPGGTPYFKEAGVAMIAKSDFSIDGAVRFFEDWDDSLGFEDCLIDAPVEPSADLCKFAGQLCYLSLGPRRTKNIDAAKYLDHIKDSGHGSVLEHASFSFLLWGIDRATTHEIVRHRAGFAFSQASQRYCDGKTLRFVERPEYQVERLPEGCDLGDVPQSVFRVALHDYWQSDVDKAVERYEAKAECLADDSLKHPMIREAKGTTVRRKRVNQAARECLPNCTEAPIVVTGNARAWRNFIDQRASAHADVPIRELAVKVLRCLQHASPLIFGDYEIVLGDDGIDSASSKWRKV